MHISYLWIKKIKYKENNLIDKILITTIFYLYYYFINNIHYFNIFKLFFYIKPFTLLLSKWNKFINYIF